jgi:TonB family protein
VAVACLSFVFSSGVVSAQPDPAVGASPPPGVEPVVEPPRVLQSATPEYPVSALETRTSGTVVIVATVSSEGRVTDARVLESLGDDFDSAALAAARQYRFAPATRNGVATAARIRVAVRFDPPPPSPAQVALSGPAHDADSGESVAPDGAGSRRRGGGQDDAQAKRERGAADADGGDNTPAPVSEVTVHGRLRPPSRGASDYNLHLGALARLPRRDATELLEFAPGILLSSEGGEGHAEQIFLRGFDARLGQDIEFSIDGVPINQVGNPEGNGYADLGFIITDLVDELRVVEGPFDPRQGNFAVAGSADYHLGLERRGLTLKYGVGSFGARRLVALYGPRDSALGTLGGAELYETRGYGQNRDARHAKAMGQYEGGFGPNNTFRFTGTAYATSYGSAGVIRQDDYEAGKAGFYDTYDYWQGGESERFSLAFDVRRSTAGGVFQNLVYLIRSGAQSRHNFTGFLLDQQDEFATPHAQRGDRIERTLDAFVTGSRGFGRFAGRWLGSRQQLELGYAARGDFVDAQQFRVEASNGVPYARDLDLGSRVANLALYADADLRFLDWLVVRGGLRAESFFYELEDRCAATSVRFAGAGFVGDASCFAQQPLGEYRDPTQRSGASGSGTFPRASVLFGPFEGFQFSLAWGRGARAIDPMYVNAGTRTPFAELTAYEGGVTYAHGFPGLELVARSIFFRTLVSKDFIFSQTEGRNTLANETSRTGWSGSVRATAGNFDVNSNLTLVRAVFEDTGLVIPYVPEAVLRADGVLHDELPWSLAGAALTGHLGLGGAYVAPRALPYGERGEALVTTEASASVGWRALEAALEVTNLFDSKLRSGEYNYASDFGSQASPTLVPARHFTAGPPRTVMFTVSVNVGGDQ